MLFSNFIALELYLVQGDHFELCDANPPSNGQLLPPLFHVVPVGDHHIPFGSIRGDLNEKRFWLDAATYFQNQMRRCHFIEREYLAY